MPRQPRELWTQEEDDDLKRLRRENPKYSWEEIIKQGNLKGRTPKSCSHRWHNYLKSDFNGGEFSPEEDEQIINLKRRRVSWASMPEDPLLKHRSPNDIKNRWYSRLKKGTATVSDPRRPLPNHVQQPLMNEETSDDSLSKADIEALISFLYNDDDLSPISSIPVSDPRRPLPNHVQQPLMNEETSDDSLSKADIEALISFLYNDDDLSPISSIPVSDPRRPLPNHVQQPLMNDQTNDYSLSNDEFKALISHWI